MNLVIKNAGETINGQTTGVHERILVRVKKRKASEFRAGQRRFRRATQLKVPVSQAEKDFASDLRVQYGTLYDAFEDASGREDWLPDNTY